MILKIVCNTQGKKLFIQIYRLFSKYFFKNKVKFAKIKEKKIVIIRPNKPKISNAIRQKNKY